MVMEAYGETIGESQRESVGRLRGVLDHALEEMQRENESGAA